MSRTFYSVVLVCGIAFSPWPFCVSANAEYKDVVCSTPGGDYGSGDSAQGCEASFNVARNQPADTNTLSGALGCSDSMALYGLGRFQYQAEKKADGKCEVTIFQPNRPEKQMAVFTFPRETSASTVVSAVIVPGPEASAKDKSRLLNSAYRQMNCKITHTAFLKFVNTCPSASPASAEVAESKLEKCARGLNSPEWYKVIDERFDVLPNNDVFFQVMIGMPPEEGIAIVRGGDVEFYSTKTMHGKEARIVGKRWVNAVAEFELRGKPFHVLFQERPDEPGIHTEILPSDGASGKDDPWPKTSIKGRPLTEKEKAQFRGQAERVLKTYVSNLNRLKEIGSIVPKEIPASCPRP